MIALYKKDSLPSIIGLRGVFIYNIIKAYYNASISFSHIAA